MMSLINCKESAERTPPKLADEIEATCGSNDCGQVIPLNIGGRHYEVSLFTLTTLCPESMLNRMFSALTCDTLISTQSLPPCRTDRSGRYFIDRDGNMFRHILNYLRNQALILPDDFCEFDLLLAEAEYYQIEPLVQLLVDAREARELVTENRYNSQTMLTTSPSCGSNKKSSPEANRRVGKKVLYGVKRQLRRVKKGADNFMVLVVYCCPGI